MLWEQVSCIANQTRLARFIGAHAQVRAHEDRYASRVLALLENIFLAMIMANSGVQMISRATETRVETAFLYVWVVAVSTWLCSVASERLGQAWYLAGTEQKL